MTYKLYQKTMLKAFFHSRLTKSESSRVRIAWGLRFFYQIGLVTSWTILTALFVQTFGIEDLLWLFGIEAALYLLGSCLASFFARRFSLDAYTYFLLFGCAGLALGALSWASINGINTGFFVLAFAAKSVFYNQLNIALYRRNEEFFSPTEAVTFMPIVESAVTLGSMAGAGLVVGSLSFMNSLNVLSLWVLACMGIAGLVFSISKALHSLPRLKKKHEKASSFYGSIDSALRVSFVKHMVVFILLQTLVFTYFDVTLTRNLQKEIVHHAQDLSYEKKDEVSPYLKTSLLKKVEEGVLHVKETTVKAVNYVSHDYIMHETLAHDLGKLHLIFGFFALLVQFLITSPILRRFGVVGAMAVNSCLILVSGVSMALGYMGITIASGIRHSTHSIGETAYHVSYYSLFTQKRESIRLFLEGIIRPLGVLCMVLLLSFFKAKELIILMPLIGFLLLLIGVHMRRAYTKLSLHNLKSQQALSSRLHAIEIMGQRGHDDSIEHLAKELQKDDEHPLVRQKIIKTITGLQNAEIISVYLEILANEKEEEEVKVRILDSMLHMKGLKKYLEEHAFSRHHLLKVLRALFQETGNNHLKKMLVMNIFQNLPSEQVVPFFLETMRSADERLQSIYLRSCQVFSDPSLQFYLKPYLDSESYRIQGHAIIALWKSGNKKQLRKKLENLSRSDQKDAQVAALYAIGEVEEKRMKEFLLDTLERRDPEIRLHAAISLAKIGEGFIVKDLAGFIMGENKKVSGMALGMIERIPHQIRNDVLHQLRKQVSSQVIELLNNEHCVECDINKLDKGTLFNLQGLYGLVGQLDDLVIIEKALSKDS